MKASSAPYSHVPSLFCCLLTCVFMQCAMSQRDCVPAPATACQKLCQTSDQSTHRRLLSDGTGVCSFVLPVQNTPFQHTDPYTGINKDTTVLQKMDRNTFLQPTAVLSFIDWWRYCLPAMIWVPSRYNSTSVLSLCALSPSVWLSSGGSSFPTMKG